MPTVPWIRLYQNWPRHKKTIALRKALGTAEPILCLWLWAAENAGDGVLEGMTMDDIEEASGWHGKRGKAAMAMIEAGFIDVDQEGGMKLHNWETRAGAGVTNLARRRERARERMRNVRANKPRTTGERGANVAGTLSLSPDLGISGSSSLSAFPDPERARDPGATTTSTEPSPYQWLTVFQARYWEAKGRQYGRGESDSLALGKLGELLASLPANERKADWDRRDSIIGSFLARTDPRTVNAGWKFSFFVEDFRGLALGTGAHPTRSRPAGISEADRKALLDAEAKRNHG